MKRIISIASLLLILLPIIAQVGTKNFIDQPYIEINGKAEMEIVPDMIYLKVVISEKDNKAKTSLEKLEQDMLKSLKNIGLNMKDDVSVIDFTSNFKSYWHKKSDIYSSKEFELIAHDGETVAKIFTELEKLNISNITIAKLDHSKIEEYRQEVKVNAAKAAKNKASKLLEAVGQRAGKVIYMQENRNYYAARTNNMEANMLMKVSSDSNFKTNNVIVEFQKLKLEYEIMARFIIE
ncbi:SIMPL domain-containing protein [Carboxylicivirga sp. N1Y90]|uniref:SIMPL domain-containing protein n=1 Tax=Carboxylicivirga fragile TaxID=3417571 RepID=UPI003D335414|nr:SIMPL domain-containing protein [Marinilabiliaceae bacterium N1Y90]